MRAPVDNECFGRGLPDLADVAYGSTPAKLKVSETSPFHPESGHIVDIPEDRKRALPDSCTAAKQHYSITSSAMASSVGGTSMPSALAVLRLIVSWYFVGC
jgi:hypothetical protein